MSLIPHTYFPKSIFDMDEWHRPYNFGLTTLDMFDPFDEIDYMMGKNFEWLKQPEHLVKYQQKEMTPKYPQKYRIMVDCAGYDPKCIKTDVSGRKLVVTGREEHKTSADDYSTKEFRKTYDLPAHAETDKLTSFVTPYGVLVIEFPLKETTGHSHSDLLPKFTEQNGHKMVQMQFSIPENIDPSKVQLSFRGRDLICKIEDKYERPDGYTRFYYYKKATMPENTDFDQLRCSYDKGRLSVLAPLRTDFKSIRSTPFNYRGQNYGGSYPYYYPYGIQYPYGGTQYGQQFYGQQPFSGVQQYGQK